MTGTISRVPPAAGTTHGGVSIVVPITSADAAATPLVEGYSRPLHESGRRFEFVFVLDGVAGRIEHELAELATRHPIKVARLHGSGLGESIALSAGVERASGDYVLTVPQYLQVEPVEILKVLQALESGAEFVATWRWPRIDPLLNRLQSRLFNWFLHHLMGIRFHDLNSGLRGMRRHVLEEVNVYGDLHRFLPVLAQRRGFKVVEVKVRHREEKGRRGWYGAGVYVRRLLDILAITFLTRFTQKPLRFFGVIGILSMVIGLALAAYPLYVKFARDESLMDKPVIVLAAVMFAFGVQLIGFGLVGEIIIFTQAKNLRDYKVDELLESQRDALPAPAAWAPRPEATIAAAAAPEPAVLRVRELLPGEDARWDAYVRQHALGTFFHRSGWRKVVEETFRHEPHYLLAEQGRQWLGVLPLFRVHSPFLGRNLISVPYAVYGGALTDDEAAFAALAQHAATLGASLGVRFVELRHREARPGERAGSDLYVTFRKQLPADPDAILPAIPKRARAEVRKARDRFGLQFEETTDLREFYPLFARNKRRLGSPSLPLRWFRGLSEEFGSDVVVHLVRTPDRRAIAGVVSFCQGDTVYAYYSGSAHGSNHTGVNDFVYCQLMEWSVRKGYATFDFGRSRRDTGPAHFKKNMGFVAEPLHYEYLLLQPGAQPPQFHPSNPRLKLPQRVWSKLPLFLTIRLGGRLSRYLP